MKKRPAPVYTDAFALCEWLLGRLGEDARELPRVVCQTAIGLVVDISQALTARQRETYVEAADERLVALRTQLRLAAAAGYLSTGQLAHAMDSAERIGRQLGGWLRALGPT